MIFHLSCGVPPLSYHKLKITCEYSTACLLHNRESVQVSLLTLKSSDVGNFLDLMVFPCSCVVPVRRKTQIGSFQFLHMGYFFSLENKEQWKQSTRTDLCLLILFLAWYSRAGPCRGFDNAVNQFPDYMTIVTFGVRPVNQIYPAHSTRALGQPGADRNLSGAAQTWEAPLPPPCLSPGFVSPSAFTECPQGDGRRDACV